MGLKEKLFCPDDCGLKNENSPICRNDCWHKDDEPIPGFLAIVWDRIERIIGKNKDEYYLESGGSVHKDRVER